MIKDYSRAIALRIWSSSMRGVVCPFSDIKEPEMEDKKQNKKKHRECPSYPHHITYNNYNVSIHT